MSKPHEPTGHERGFPVVELRQYTLHPGQRDTLVTLFDREFIETQERIGMQLWSAQLDSLPAARIASSHKRFGT